MTGAGSQAATYQRPHPSSAPGGRRIFPALVALAGCGIAVGVYSDFIALPLISDDYEWLQFARNALAQPSLFFRDLGTFYRPLATLSWALTYFIAGPSAGAHHVANLVLHLVCTVLFTFVLARFALRGPWLIMATFLFALNFHGYEAVVAGSSRFQPILFSLWLGLILAWPEDWANAGKTRLVTVIVLIAALVLAKETWVVTPFLVLILARAKSRLSWRRALIATGACTLMVIAYLITYGIAFGFAAKGYYSWGTHLIFKPLYLLGNFFELIPYRPVGFHFEPRLVLVIIVTLGLAILARPVTSIGVFLGLFFLVAPILPTLPSQYLPIRWLYVPWAGFLACLGTIGVAVQTRLSRESPRIEGLISIAVILTTGVIALAHVRLLRSEFKDAQAVATAHQRLLTEARAIATRLPVSGDCFFVRLEHVNPYAPITRHFHGVPKLFFRRPDDPYGLIEASALFDYVLAPSGKRACAGTKPQRWEDTTAPTCVIVHRAGHFGVDHIPAPPAAIANTLKAQGRPLRIIRFRPACSR